MNVIIPAVFFLIGGYHGLARQTPIDGAVR